jgi:hypothetical protein
VGCEIYNDISTSVDVSTDFSKYQTFAWLTDKADTNNQPYDNEIIRNNLRTRIEQDFIKRGYEVNIDAPDILLKCVIVNKKKERVVLYPTYPYPPNPYPYPYYYGSIFYFPYDFNNYYRYYPFYAYPSNYISQTYDFIEGAIILNVFDRRQNKLVWSATAKGDIYDPEYINENIQPAVKAMMKNYPVSRVFKQTNIKTPDTSNIYP